MLNKNPQSQYKKNLLPEYTGTIGKTKRAFSTTKALKAVDPALFATILFVRSCGPFYLAFVLIGSLSVLGMTDDFSHQRNPVQDAAVASQYLDQVVQINAIHTPQYIYSLTHDQVHDILEHYQRLNAMHLGIQNIALDHFWTLLTTNSPYFDIYAPIYERGRETSVSILETYHSIGRIYFATSPWANIG